MVNKKEIIKWVELQINKAYKPLLPNIRMEDVRLVCDSHIKDKLTAEMVTYFIKNTYGHSKYKYEFTLNIDPTSELFKPIEMIMENIHKKEDFIRNANKEIAEHDELLKAKLAKFKEDMLLIGNKDLADYAKAFIESLR